MDTTPGFTPAMLSDQTSQSDLVRRKLEMDSLRKRLGDVKSKEEKLRESCEGFEAIFLQKMWEQMRKTVPKEGYLHSKDEEMYQSLFDVELSKKMAGAGGIGLADMLYEQLSQQLEDSGRTTSPSAYRTPLQMPAAGLLAEQKAQAPSPAAPSADNKSEKALTPEYLYSPLAGESAAPEETTSGTAIENALYEIQAELGLAPRGDAGSAIREWAKQRESLTGTTPDRIMEDAAAVVHNNTPGPDASSPQGTGGASHLPPRKGIETVPAGTATPQGSPVSAGIPPQPAASPGPDEKKVEANAGVDTTRLFGRRRKTNTEKAETVQKSAPTQPRGMAPAETLWPLAGDGGVVVSHFGWEDDKAKGRRNWNSGVRITAPAQSPVRAVLDGTVVYSGQREGFGHTVVIEHKNGFRSYYSNLEDASIRVGDPISRGAEFAKIAAQPPQQAKGENSASLHFELKKGEMALNPENAIEQRGA